MRLLYLALMCFLPLDALILEDLGSQDVLAEKFAYKKIGYFVGSFDPLHKAHEMVAHAVLDLDLCDYVLIYPAWGGDQYKKRSAIEVRLDMLFAAFADHPHIIVTRLAPQELQNTLTMRDAEKTTDMQTFRKPAWQGTEFIGILGSDTALYLDPNPETSLYYMSGLEIPPEYATHTWGSCMALPAESFIVALRNDDNITHLHGYIRERPICTVLSLEQGRYISSTLIKKAIQQNECFKDLVGEPIRKLIERNGMYR